jgi:hypothetical protein
MTGYAARFIFLVSICCADIAFAQSSSANLRPVRDALWINVEMEDDLSPINAGLNILAQNVEDNSPSAVAVGRHRDGIGASGAQASAPAIKAETGFDPVQNRSEQIIIVFDQPVMRADVGVTYFYRGEAEHSGAVYHERGGWRAYRGKLEIGQGLFLPDTVGGTHQIVITTREPFDRLEMFATPYVTESGMEIEPGLITTDSSDFLIQRIAYRPQHEAHASAGH